MWGRGQAQAFFFFFKFIYLLFLAALGPLCRAGFSLDAPSVGRPLVQCASFWWRWLLLSRSTGSRRASSVVVAHGPSLSSACGILPEQGLHPDALHWQADSQPLDPTREAPGVGSEVKPNWVPILALPAAWHISTPKVAGCPEEHHLLACSTSVRGLRLLLAHGGQFQWLLLLLLSLTATLSPRSSSSFPSYCCYHDCFCCYYYYLFLFFFKTTFY